MSIMTSTKNTELLPTLAEAALVLAAQLPWHKITLSDLCAQGGVSLVDCAKASVTKADVTAHMDALIDQAMLGAQTIVDRTQSVRDRLFDVLMSRFDAMEDNRGAWISILEAETRDIVASLARAARRARGGAWALEACGVSSSDLRGAGRAIGVARILRLSEAAWLGDGEDLAKTMARLDQELRKGEALVERANAAASFFRAKPAAEPTL